MTTSPGWDDTFDVLVLGAGAGGMTAALVASLEGKRTLLLEKTEQIGGTTARSSGTVWIPNNPHQRRLAPADDSAAARCRGPATRQPQPTRGRSPERLRAGRARARLP